MKEKEFDPFVNYTVYPTAVGIFDGDYKGLDTVKDSCVFVLDTNALLLPFSTGSHSLSEIKRIYEKLKLEKRLVVPGQVAREFANNRPEKLKEFFQQLNRKRNDAKNLSVGKYPLMENLEVYTEALKLEREINDKINEYRKTITQLIETVKEWNWNDPVSQIYRELFSSDLIVDIDINKDTIKKELSYRYAHQIPPGFKDSNKEDSGLGDFIIWLTLLEVGRGGSDIVFVSGDEKSDWYHRSENQALYPRFELTVEFHRVTQGRSLNIIRLSELLTLFGADERAVTEIAVEEISQPAVSFGRGFRVLEDILFEWMHKIGYTEIRFLDEHFDFDARNASGQLVAIEYLMISRHTLSRTLANRLPRLYSLSKQNGYDQLMILIILNDFSDHIRPKKEIVEVIGQLDENYIKIIYLNLSKDNQVFEIGQM